MNAEAFAQRVLQEMREDIPDARLLQARARGKTAVIGYDDQGEWVPLFRFAHASGSFNVAQLQVRRRTKWEPTLVRGIPRVIADELVGPLRFLWESELEFMSEP